MVTPASGPGSAASRWAVPALAGGAVLLRLPLLGAAEGNDEGGYLAVAHQWHQAGGSLYGRYWVDRPPLLITLFQLADSLGGLTALRLLGALAAGAAVLGVAATAGQVGGRRSAASGRGHCRGAVRLTGAGNRPGQRGAARGAVRGLGVRADAAGRTRCRGPGRGRGSGDVGSRRRGCAGRRGGAGQAEHGRTRGLRRDPGDRCLAHRCGPWRRPASADPVGARGRPRHPRPRGDLDRCARHLARRGLRRDVSLPAARIGLVVRGARRRPGGARGALRQRGDGQRRRDPRGGLRLDGGPSTARRTGCVGDRGRPGVGCGVDAAQRRLLDPLPGGGDRAGLRSPPGSASVGQGAGAGW